MRWGVDAIITDTTNVYLDLRVELQSEQYRYLFRAPTFLQFSIAYCCVHFVDIKMFQIIMKRPHRDMQDSSYGRH